LLARDGSTLAEGAVPAGASEGERPSPLGAAATSVVGKVGPIPASERTVLEAQGVPGNATVGLSGLERAFDAQLRGRPGGQLLAGGRPIASAIAQPSSAVRTSISPSAQRAAVLALGGQLGGVVVLRPRGGEILAVAGLGIDDLQPPGSTFKMVTLPAVLEAGIARTSSTFPYETTAVLDGVQLHNAGGESCGGTLTEAFAQSCNSVFAPLGAKLGSARLVAMAERFGFNHSPGIPGAAESSIPPASEIKGELDTGSTAIGQGQVLASPLQMAIVAATVADAGRRPEPTFRFPAPPVSAGAGAQVMTPATARIETELMLDVVRNGTGTSGAISGVEVAGKTGTAELGGTGCSGGSLPETGSSAESSATASCAAAERNNTDAWFAAFAPARHPRIVSAAMLVHDGYGGETAAPVVRQAMEGALEASP
jgi:cell division protein FtsI/penicillin-binding protein 2